MSKKIKFNIVLFALTTLLCFSTVNNRTYACNTQFFSDYETNMKILGADNTSRKESALASLAVEIAEKTRNILFDTFLVIINAKPKLAEYILKEKIDPNGVIKEPLPDDRDEDNSWLGNARSGDMISMEQIRIEEAKARQRPVKKKFHEQSYLIYAAKKGHLALVRALLKSGADRNAVSNMGHTALTAAWYSGNKDIMEAIINEGADLSDENRTLALIYAASRNKIDLLDTLLKKGFDPNTKYKSPAQNFTADFRCAAADIINKMDERGRHTEISVTPLIAAIVEGNLPAVKKLIAAGARTDIGRGRNAPLLVSIGFSRYEITQFLIENGANINATGPCGESPLIYAVYLDDYPTARLLVERGADINAAFSSITAPVMSLASNNPDMISLFTGRGVDLKKQLNSNFDIDFLNWSGTPLKIAIRNQSVSGVRYILGQMQEMNDNFLTEESIREACATQNYEIVKLLADAGAPVTPGSLRATLWHGNDEIKKLIFDRKCHQTSFALSPYEVYEMLGSTHPNEQYFTPFLSEYALIKKMPVREDSMPWNLPEFPQKLKAVFKSEFEKNGLKEKAAQIIIDRDTLPPSKENVDVRSGNGNTALNALAEMPNNNDNLIKMLLENGADINAKNGSGAPPLLTALKRGTVETYELLSEKGAELGLSPSQIVYELTHDAERNGKLFLLYIEHLAKKSPPSEEGKNFFESIISDFQPLHKKMEIFELIISELRPLHIGYLMDKKIAPFDASDSESVKLCSENIQKQYFNGDFSIKMVNCIYIAGRLGFTPERIIASIRQSGKNTADDKSLLEVAVADRKLMDYFLSKNIKLDIKEKKELIISAYTYGDASIKEDILSFMDGESPADGIWNKIAAGDESEIRRNKLTVNENVVAMTIFLKNGKTETLKKIVSAAGLNNDEKLFKNYLIHAIDDRDYILIKILFDYGLSGIDSRDGRNSYNAFYDLDKKIIELGSPDILDDYAKKIISKQSGYKTSFLKCLIRNNRKDYFFKYFEEFARSPRSSAPESPKGLGTDEIEDVLSASLYERQDEISDFLFDKLEGGISDEIAQAALGRGNTKIARTLEARGIRITNPSEALENNILKGDRKGFDYVLSKVSEKDINAPVKIYDNPLYRAINKNDSYYLEKLIDKGINLKPSLNKEGDYTMFGDIRHKKVIGRQAESVEEIDTPLLCALDMNRDIAAVILARHEPSINKAGIRCRTALELAVEKNFTEAALAIIGRPDLDMRSGAIESAFKKAVTTENLSVIEALIARGYRPFASFEPESLKRFIDVKNASIQAVIRAMQAQNIPQSKITETLLKCGTATEEILLGAIKSGDTAATELLAAPGLDIDYTDSNGKTALTYAIKLGREKTIDMLLKKGANPNLGDIYKNPPALYAVIKKRYDLLKKLVEHGANIDARNAFKVTPLYAALANGDTQSVNFLLEKKASMPVSLFRAIEAGDAGVVEKLLDLGASPDVCGEYGNNGLEYANSFYHKITRLLLSRGARKDFTDDYEDYQKCVKMISDRQKSEDVIERLKIIKNLDHKSTTSHSLMHALIRSDYDWKTIERVIQMGANVNAVDREGKTVLMLLLSKNYIVDENTLKYFKNISAIDNVGNNALFYCQNSIPNTIYLLVKNGLKINARNLEGKTPLIKVFSGGINLDAVRGMISCGANVNAKTKEGLNALMYIAKRDNDEKIYEAVDLLVRAGANINDTDNNGDTPLILAAREGKLTAVKAFLKNGADVNIKNLKGESALTESGRWRQSDEILLLLIGSGANIKFGENGFDDSDVLMELFSCRNQKIINHLLDINSDKIGEFDNRLAETLKIYCSDDKFIATLVHIARLKNVPNEKMWNLLQKYYKIDDRYLLTAIISYADRELINFLMSNGLEFPAGRLSELLLLAEHSNNPASFEILLNMAKLRDGATLSRLRSDTTNGKKKELIKILIKNIPDHDHEFLKRSIEVFTEAKDIEGMTLALKLINKENNKATTQPGKTNTGIDKGGKK